MLGPQSVEHEADEISQALCDEVKLLLSLVFKEFQIIDSVN